MQLTVRLIIHPIHYLFTSVISFQALMANSLGSSQCHIQAWNWHIFVTRVVYSGKEHIPKVNPSIPATIFAWLQVMMEDLILSLSLSLSLGPLLNGIFYHENLGSVLPWQNHKKWPLRRGKCLGKHINFDQNISLRLRDRSYKHRGESFGLYLSRHWPPLSASAAFVHSSIRL